MPAICPITGRNSTNEKPIMPPNFNFTQFVSFALPTILFSNLCYLPMRLSANCDRSNGFFFFVFDNFRNPKNINTFFLTVFKHNRHSIPVFICYNGGYTPFSILTMSNATLVLAKSGISSAYLISLINGKSVERRRRKATGLRDSRLMTAGLPEKTPRVSSGCLRC